MSNSETKTSEDNASNNDVKGKGKIPLFHLQAAFPDASSIFSVSLPPLHNVIDSAVVVPDTNVLLVPYTVESKSLAEIKKVYSTLIERNQLIIPAQVAREFVSNKGKKIGELYDSLSKERDGLKPVKINRYRLLESTDEYNKLVEIEKQIAERQKEYRETIQKLLDKIRAWQLNDPVSEIYRELFNSKIISAASDESPELEKEFRHKAASKIPPGYKDAGKSDEGIGDFLIWKTILQIGSEQKRDVVFVTGEEKPDWWILSNKTTLYPRHELIDEFWRESGGKSFHIIKFSELLKLYNVETPIVEDVEQSELRLQTVDSETTNLKDGAEEKLERVRTAVKQWLQEQPGTASVLPNPNSNVDFAVYTTLAQAFWVQFIWLDDEKEVIPRKIDLSWFNYQIAAAVRDGLVVRGMAVIVAVKNQTADDLYKFLVAEQGNDSCVQIVTGILAGAAFIARNYTRL